MKRELERSTLCGPKVCADCSKKFYGWGYIKGKTRPDANIFEEVFCVNEICICYTCYQKYKKAGD